MSARAGKTEGPENVVAQHREIVDVSEDAANLDPRLATFAQNRGVVIDFNADAMAERLKDPGVARALARLLLDAATKRGGGTP